MACTVFAKTDGKESELYKELESILGEEMATSEYSKISGDKFKKMFGDYEQGYKNGYSEDINLPEGSKMSQRVNVQGEPKLIKKRVIKGDKVTEYNQYYFQFENGIKKYINKTKFKGINSDQAEEVTNVLLNAFVSENIQENFEDLSRLDPKKIITTIDNFIENYKNSVNNPELLAKADLVSLNKQEFKSEILNKIEELGLTYRQSIINEKGEYEYEVSEDEKAGGINIAESFEKNSKESAPARIKLMLSLLPDVRTNPEFQQANKRLSEKHKLNSNQIKELRLRYKKGEKIGNLSEQDIKDLAQMPYVHRPDSFLGKAKFAEFDDVWGTLQPLLSDIVSYSEGGDLVNAFEIMKTEIKKIAQVKPWVSGLMDRMNKMDSNQQAQFVQTFSKARLNFYVTEYDGATNKYKIINATSTNSRESKIRGSWGNNFIKKFTNGYALTEEGTLLVNEIKNTAYNDRVEFGKNIAKTTNEQQRMRLSIESMKSLIENLNELGTELSINDFVSYIRMTGGEEKIVESVLDLYSSFDYLSKYILDTKNFTQGDEKLNPFENQDGIKLLSKAKSLFEVNMAENNILANNGKSYFSYSNPSYLHNITNQWKKDSTGLEQMSLNAYNKGSRWIKYLLNSETNRQGALIARNSIEREKESKRRIDNVQIGLDSSFKSRGENNGKDTKEISPVDALNNAISKVLGNKIVGGKNYAQTLLAADKGRKIEIEGLPSFDSRIDFIDGEWFISDDSISVMTDYFNDEYSRMKEVSNELKSLPANRLIVHYHTGAKNGLKSQIFPGLSPENMDKNSLEYITLYNNDLPLGNNEDGTYSMSGMTNDQRIVVKEYIKRVITERLNDNLNNMNEMGIISLSAKNEAINLSVNQDILDSYKDYTDPLRALSADYFMNSVINTIEYNKLFLGDPAFFKNMSDMIKRTPASYTDGLQLFLSKNDHEHFNQATVKGVEIASRYVDLIRSSVKDKSIADAYSKGGVNSTDAQAWITPRRWRFLKERLGQWTTGKDSHQSAWEKMMYINPKNGKVGKMLTQKEMKLVAQPLKGVYFEINGKRPTYLKYSQAVLIPQLTVGTPMQKLLDKMTKDANGEQLSGKDEIHEVVTIDGVKVGAVAPTKINEDNGDMSIEFDLNPVPLKNIGWKLQQDLPTKLAHETMVGSQIQKNILAGITADGDYNFNGENVKGSEILKMVHKTLDKLSNIGKQDLINEFDIIEDADTGKLTINNMDRLYSSLISEFKSRGGNDNVLSALEKDMPFDAIPQIRNKVENVFMSMMNKKLTKVYTNGGSFIQVSQFGFDSITDREKAGIKIVSNNYDKKGLKPPYYDKATGKYMPGQCFMPHSALLKLLPEGIDWNGMSGKDLMKLIDPSALELVTYRIPNQGMSSNDAMEIVGILPPGVGDSIIAYDAVPAKTGSDFDIDKMYVMMPNLHLNKKTGKVEALPHTDNSESLKAVQNRLIDLYSSILKSESAYDKVMTSIDASFFKDDIVKMFPETKLNDLKFYSPEYQMKTKFEYLSGKIGVAQTANQLVDHMVNKHQNIRFDTNIGVGNTYEGLTKFDDEYDRESNHLISDSISAFLNAYVDIAKDPYISRGNHNGITSNVTFMLLRAGVPVEKVNRFIGQPVLQELTRYTKNSEGITSQELKIDEDRLNATEYVKRKYGLGTFEAGSEDIRKLFDNSNKDLEKTISKFNQDNNFENFDDNDKDLQEQTINIFEHLQKMSKYFTDSVSASKTPDAGDFAQLMVAKNKYTNVIIDDKIVGFEEKFDKTFTGTYRENGVNWVDKLAKDNNLFISSNEALQNTINSMSQRTGKGSFSTDEEYIKQISGDFYSYAMSGLGLFENNLKEMDLLFNKLPSEIEVLKQAKSTNFLIQELEIKYSGGYNFLKINSKNKPKTYNNKIYRAWVDLLRSKDKNERLIGNRLIRYAFTQSGFKTNLNQFFTHIPHEALENAGISEHINNVHSDMNSSGLSEQFRDQMFRHSYDNKKIVQRVSSNNAVPIKTNLTSVAFMYDPGSETKGSIKTGTDMDGNPTYPEFVSRVFYSEDFMTGEKSESSSLYKFEGMAKREITDEEGNTKEKYFPVYIKTFKLGAKFNNGSILEYQYDKNSQESVIPANNLTEENKLVVSNVMKDLNEMGLFFDEDMISPFKEKDVSLPQDEETNTSDNPLTC